MITDSQGIQVVAGFEQYMVESLRNYSAETIRKYVITARQYVEAVPDWAEPDAAKVEQFLRKPTWQPDSQRNKLSHLKAFYLWAEKTGRAPFSPCSTVEVAPHKLRLPRPMRTADVQWAILSAVYVENYQLIGMMSLMAGCGLRCCEVAAAKWADIDMQAQRIIVLGKGDRERALPVPPNVIDAVERLDRRSRSIFVSPSTGKPYTPTRVSQIVNQHLRGAGITDTAHQFRHWFATDRLEVTGSLAIVRDLLGHSSVTTTENYAALAPGLRFDFRPVEVPGL